MALTDPVAVYNAANNLEARMLSNLLNDAEIEAYSTEDVSPVGVCVFGLISEIHKPQVWTDRTNIERVKPILEDYERRQLQRQQAEANEASKGKPTMEAICKECGHHSVFSIAQQGTVQDCPHCGAYMDVEDPASFSEDSFIP
jgi:rRNA maturation protein Nop10